MRNANELPHGAHRQLGLLTPPEPGSDDWHDRIILTYFGELRDGDVYQAT